MIELISQPWPWYVSGPLIGLSIPTLLILGNKSLGISSFFRHICAACVPGNIEFLKYNWREEMWNIVFVVGIILGGYVGFNVISHPSMLHISQHTINDLQQSGIQNFAGFMPTEIFSWSGLLSLKGFIFIVVGGFLVGFGTRYAGGCTSGHAIMGLSNLQFPSLMAVIGFFIGGLLMTHLLLPILLKS